jgi:hypothetical protein
MAYELATPSRAPSADSFLTAAAPPAPGAAGGVGESGPKPVSVTGVEVGDAGAGAREGLLRRRARGRFSGTP